MDEPRCHGSWDDRINAAQQLIERAGARGALSTAAGKRRVPRRETMGRNDSEWWAAIGLLDQTPAGRSFTAHCSKSTP